MLAVFILGITVGSFLNVCIHRLPLKQSLAFPASHCPHCSHPLQVWDLVPVLSYIFLRGRCRYCRESIAIRYPLVELLTGIMFLLAYWQLGISWAGLAAVLFFTGLIVCSAVDLQHYLIPDQVLLLMFLTGVPLLYLQSPGLLGWGLVGGLAGGLILLILSFIYPEGIGGGDIKLAFVIGFYLGWQQMLLVLWLASLLGIILFIGGKGKREEGKMTVLPFGLCLAVGSVISFHWHPELIQLIMGGG